MNITMFNIAVGLGSSQSRKAGEGEGEESSINLHSGRFEAEVVTRIDSCNLTPTGVVRLTFLNERRKGLSRVKKSKRAICCRCSVFCECCLKRNVVGREQVLSFPERQLAM